MYSRFTLFVVTLLLAFSVFIKANEPEIGTDKNGAKYVKGELIVKLAAHVDISTVDDFDSRAKSPSAYFGIASLDATLQPMGAISIEKSFKGASNLKFTKNLTNSNLAKQAQNLEHYYKVQFDQAAPLDKIIAGLKREPNVELVEYSYVYETTDMPSDALYSGLQHLPQISAEQAWQIHKGENGPEVIIGINDTGCQWDHPDLFPNLKVNYDEWTNREAPLFITQNNRLVINPAAIDGIDSDGNGYIDDVVGYNFNTSDGSPANDPYGSTANTHGTHVAGIAAGVTNNGVGISSISWNVKFLPTKHSALSGAQYLYNVEQGLWYMATAGVDVINMSWGGGGFSQMLIDLFIYLDDSGITCISSAGNANNQIPSYPNSYPRVMSIASVASNDVRAYYSTYGIQTDVSAPGGDAYVDGGINSTYPLNTYRKLQGTSMAGPLVAGLAGLIKSYHPDWTPFQIRRQIAGSSDDVYTANPTLVGKLGAGRINAHRALTETNLTLSTEPRIGYFSTSCQNQNGNLTISPGDDAYLSVLLRNYNMFHDAGALVFKLSTDNPNVTVIGYDVVKYIKADDLVNVTGFATKVSSSAKPAIVKLNIRVEKQDGTFLIDIPIQFNIAGGVLVYEHIPGSAHQSGTFLKNELSGYGLDVVYTNSMPTSFNGFNAVFLTLGNYSQSPIFQVTSEFFTTVSNYLMSGGKLFMDASSLMAGQVIPNLSAYELQVMFGISGANYGNPTTVPFNQVNGLAGTLAQGLTFFGTSQPSGYLIERYTPSAGYGGKAMLSEATYGNVGVQTAGVFGQRVVMMSFALGGYNDSNCPSTKSVLLKRIINFMGLVLPIKIDMPTNFTICRNGEVQIIPAETYDCETNSFVNQSVTGGSGDYSFNWSPSTYLQNANTANPTVKNLAQNTVFKLKVTDNMFGIKGEYSNLVSVVQPPNVGTKTLVREKVNSYKNLNSYITNYSSSNTYSWFEGNTPIDATTASNWKVKLGTTKLYVSATDEYGCVSSVLRGVTLIGTYNKEGEEQTQGLYGFSSMQAYPTVVNDIMNISADFASEESYSITVTDLLGNVVFIGEKGLSQNYDGAINLSQLGTGAYMLIIETPSDRLVKKFVKM